MQTKTKQSTTNIPKLRFPGFFEGWKSKKLGDVAEIKRGAASQYLNYTYDIEKGVRLLRINDFLKDNAVFVEDVEDMKKYRVKEGDLLIAGTGATAGIIFIVPKKFDGAAFSYNVPRIRIKDANNKFVYLYLKSDLVIKQQKRLFVGNAQHFLDTKTMRGFKISFPNIEEQQKIADFLGGVDDWIGNLKSQKESLELYKKGIMQKIFPSSLSLRGASSDVVIPSVNNPTFRFKDEKGDNFTDWEDKKLKEVFDSKKGVGLPKDKLSNNGKNECILYGELYTTYNEVVHKIKSKTDVDKGLLSKKGDLLIPCSTTTTGIDLANVTALNKEKVLLGGDITVLRSKEKIDNIFYSYYLSNYKKTEIAKYAQGVTIIHLYYNHFKKMMIHLPAFEEQQKIADFLTSIDNMINSKQDKIKKVEEWKKGLMYRLFV